MSPTCDVIKAQRQNIMPENSMTNFHDSCHFVSQCGAGNGALQLSAENSGLIMPPSEYSEIFCKNGRTQIFSDDARANVTGTVK